MCRLLLICSLLAGCGGGSILRGTGERVDPPAGYTQYCQQHPDRAECGGVK